MQKLSAQHLYTVDAQSKLVFSCLQKLFSLQESAAYLQMSLGGAVPLTPVLEDFWRTARPLIGGYLWGRGGGRQPTWSLCPAWPWVDCTGTSSSPPFLGAFPSHCGYVQIQAGKWPIGLFNSHFLSTHYMPESVRY